MGWDFDDVRDHYLSTVFNTDVLKLRYSDHERYLALGRLATGEVMARSFAEWRRPASSCRGALVWFLRDLWAGAGWGLVDDLGMPKACFYFLKRVLQPVAVLLSDEGLNGLFAHVINERGEDRQLVFELTAWRDGDVCVASGRKILVMPAHSAQSFSCQDLLGHFVDLTHAYRFGPIACDAVVATLQDEHGRPIGRAFHFPGGLDTQRSPDLGLSARATMTGPRTAELTVHTRHFARGVHFEVPGFHADEDYFHLPPDASINVRLVGKGSYPLSGFVHAANSTRSARIDVVPSAATAASQAEVK